jgi:IS4 transposase
MGKQTKLRRVTTHVEINGNWHDLVFLTNNFEWTASTIADLYKSRWQVEILFKELKQTLQLQDFFGENEKAIQWQIWSALLTHLVMRYLKFKSRAVCSYSRFVAFIRAIVWLKKRLDELPGILWNSTTPRNCHTTGKCAIFARV